VWVWGVTERNSLREGVKKYSLQVVKRRWEILSVSSYSDYVGRRSGESGFHRTERELRNTKLGGEEELVSKCWDWFGQRGLVKFKIV